MSGAVRMVCFDWGGVIVRICRSWAEGCAAAGIPLRGDVQAPAFIARRREVSGLYHTGRIGCDDFYRQMSETMNGMYSPDEVRRVHDAWLLGEYEGVDDLVNALHRVQDLRTGMLSNTNHGHWRRQFPVEGLSHFPTAGLLHHRHASHVLNLAKPDAAIYRAFERETGVDATSILFFDDLIENVDAARACGWRAEQIDHTRDTAPQMRAHLARHGIGI